MFINSKKSYEIREGGNSFTIPRDYIGEVPGWVASHWLVQAAMKDGSIAAPKNTTDRALEEADEKAEGKKEPSGEEPELPEGHGAAVKEPKLQKENEKK